MSRGRENLVICSSCGRRVPRTKAVSYSRAVVYSTDLKTAEDGAERSSQAIANAVRKLLIVYDEFNAPGGE